MNDFHDQHWELVSHPTIAGSIGSSYHIRQWPGLLGARITSDNGRVYWELESHPTMAGSIGSSNHIRQWPRVQEFNKSVNPVKKLGKQVHTSNIVQPLVLESFVDFNVLSVTGTNESAIWTNTEERQNKKEEPGGTVNYTPNGIITPTNAGPVSNLFS